MTIQLPFSTKEEQPDHPKSGFHFFCAVERAKPETRVGQIIVMANKKCRRGSKQSIDGLSAHG
jgi:hypothetical protein